MVSQGLFFQHCWPVVGDDIVAAMVNFFKVGYVPLGVNSNFMIPLPKSEVTDSIDQFRPIMLINFLFKIITKVLLTRLADIAEKVVSAN